MGKTLSNLDELMRWKHAIDKQNKKLSKQTNKQTNKQTE